MKVRGTYVDKLSATQVACILTSDESQGSVVEAQEGGGEAGVAAYEEQWGANLNVAPYKVLTLEFSAHEETEVSTSATPEDAKTCNSQRSARQEPFWLRGMTTRKWCGNAAQNEARNVNVGTHNKAPPRSLMIIRSLLGVRGGRGAWHVLMRLPGRGLRRRTNCGVWGCSACIGVKSSFSKPGKAQGGT